MQDLDPVETQEWLDALESVLDREGEDRAHYLMTRMGELASRSGTQLPYAITTPYRNTIPVTHEARIPATCSWNAGFAPWCAGTPWRW